MKRIKLQEGFKLDLVASEPIINEPVVIEWDANGRLYVVDRAGRLLERRRSVLLLLLAAASHGRADCMSDVCDARSPHR